ncbi:MULTISPECIES: hypothetical protein [Methanothrix]|jgi:hypothetical protein|uniref:hypothetical protein n=1 Tax=Methanothrix TaxID=2222 RepID=UPI0023554D8D|nr:MULTISPECIES: hypothetical protein [Methanothrix]MDY0388766.1 hypothetical protein [Methanolobus sp.]
MSYVGSGQLPIEHASKIGHMKFIQDAHIQRMLSEFESTTSTAIETIGFRTGHIDINKDNDINFIIAIDGGESVVPNEIRSHKRLAFISVCALLLRVQDIEEMRQCPIIDPRDLPSKLQVWNNPAILPLSGIRHPNETIKDTIRKTIDSTMHYTGLYNTLKFLVSREWDLNYEMGLNEAPHFCCRNCGEVVYIPKSALSFRCLKCKHLHTLSDYLGIGEDSPEEWAREEAATALRDVLETLTLFHFVRIWYQQPNKLGQVLFIKDGPLLLRAGLYRLSDSIRALIQYLRDNEIPLNLVGIEKNGELVNHIEEIKENLPEPGDYFAPTVKYIIENIRGYTFDPSTYRNRVQYGSKVVARLGPHHVVPIDIPTGDFLLEPSFEDLYRFKESLTVLAKMTCYKYENALIPIVLANAYASISQRPSGDILYSFASRFFS